MHLKQGACPQESKGQRLTPKGRALRFGFVFAGLLMMVPYVAGQHDGDTRSPSEPRLKTSKPFHVERLAISHATVSQPGAPGVGRTAQDAGACTFQSTHTDADFEGPGMFSILFGFSQAEIAAASYVIDPALFPIRVEQVEMVFAQTGLEDKTTELKLWIYEGTPDQGQWVGQIDHTLNFPNCGDNAFCNGIEICQDGGCTSVAPPCFGQFCDEANDTCVQCLSAADCQDGVFCNGAELCQGGACVSGEDACTVEQLCDEIGQQCVIGECLVDSDCSNGDFCDGPRLCVANMCQDGPAPCAPEDCNENTNQCACAEDVDCDDGNPCTTDTCPAKVVCVFTEISCTDGDPCTVDSCNRANGQCVHDDVTCAADEQCHPNSGDCVECLSDGDCDDQLVCSGTETCVAGSCVPGDLLCPGQLCDEGSGTCFDSSCDAVNVVIDGLDVLVNNNGTDTFSVAFQIISHNDPSDNPCLDDPSASNNVFPTVDVSGVSDDQNNWMNVLNCGPLDCPPGWRTFDGLSLCEPDGDWVLRACWSPEATPLFGACCFDDGTCQPDVADVTCEADGGVFQDEDSICEPGMCDPIGACCLPNDDMINCFTLSEAICMGTNGTWVGVGSDCTDLDGDGTADICEPQLGACCLPSGICQNTTLQEDCEAQGGFYNGESTFCSQVVCEGACCFDQTCLGDSTDAGCPFDWRGPNVSCDDEVNPCLEPTPQGACCPADGTACSLEDEDVCEGQGSSWFGPGSNCATIECDQPPTATGACCLDTGECLIITEVECIDVNGAYQGDATNCSACQTEACCFEGAGCLDLPLTTCNAAAGNPLGEGTTCLTHNCPQPEGACCFETGLCLDLTLGECAQGGASWQGADISCADEPDPCGAATGACCLDGGGCLGDQSAAACTVLGGTYQGDFSDCASANCSPATGACCRSNGDCTLDQTVDECAAVEGEYLGDDSDCSACITEACCLDGICSDFLALPCLGAGGEPQGAGTDCANTDCSEAPTGACCGTDGTCNEVLEADCTAGTYQGDDTTCAQAGCCQMDSDCDDNDECNGQETCIDNACVDDSPLDCNDDNECTDDGCDPAAGCTNVLIDCDDSSECTDDGCDPAMGCTNVPIDCDDSDACTVDGCNLVTGCTHEPIDCDDSDDCTSDGCNPASGCFNDLIEPCCGNGITEPAAGEDCDPPDGVTCDENCQLLPTGACCLITGNCLEDVSNIFCIAVGGTWQGEGMICEPGLCETCTPGDGAAENDCCADMIPIFTGSTAFTTVNANTDGPPHDACLFFGQDQTHHDIWYDYLADCSGNVTVTTCEELGGSADYDTKLVVYDGCDCDALTLIECNDDDDDPENACGQEPDFHSTVTFSAVEGNCYLVRLGSFNAGALGEGTGSLFIECAASCPADFNGDGEVGPFDLATLLGAWGPCPGCPADINGDDVVGPFDLATLLGAWGPCP